MKFRTRILPLAVAGAVGLTMPAFAQQGERIEVTGSLLKRVEGETALPIVVISVEDLAKAGVTNAEQAVRLITQQQGGTVKAHERLRKGGTYGDKWK